MFWLGLFLPVGNWLGILAAIHFEITAHALTGPWFVAGLALVFVLGAILPTPAALFRGLAVGLGLSSAVAVAQSLGWDAVPSMEKPAGLFYNSAIHATVIAMVILALICGRDWRYIPALLPGLWLSGSRGGVLVLAIGLLAMVSWRQAVLALLVVAAVAVTWPGPSGIDRLLIWNVAWHGLTWAGHGAGSFANLLFAAKDGLHYPGHAHNDYLQLAYEFGLGAIPVYLVYAAVLAQTGSTYWPAFVGFAVAGLFFFPLYAPVPAFIGALLAGHILGPPVRAVAGRALTLRRA